MLIAARSASPRRLRAAGPQGQRGASSLLRLSQQATGRLPSSSALAGWISRAAQSLDAQGVRS